MDRVDSYNLSYKYNNEGLDDKINRLEELEPSRYTDIIGNSEKDAIRYPLYHGLRFNPIDKLESILISGYIYPGNKVPNKFSSYDGTIHYLSGFYNDNENCNKGEYISLIPFYWDDIEFDTFIRSSIYLALRGDVNAIKTIYLKYEDYIKLRNSKRRTINLYSYAYNEYLAKDSISLDNLLYIGIDSRYFNIPGLDVNEVIAKVIELIDAYDIRVPFYDLGTCSKIYQRDNNDELRLG